MSEYVTFHDLKGASVFITGGGAGIGAALTEGFLEQGANVAFVQRSDATAFCDDMAARHGRRPLFIACDITDIAALQNATAIALLEKAPEYDLAVYRALARFVAAYLSHLDLEEVGAMPALLEKFDEMTLSGIQRRIVAATAPSILRYNLKAILPAVTALERAEVLASLCARLGPAEIAELRASLGGLVSALDWPTQDAVTAA